MVTVTVTVESDVMEVLQTLAEMKHTTVEEILRGMVIEDLQRIQERMKDPIIGFLDSGTGDIARRDEDILRDEWQPD